MCEWYIFRDLECYSAFHFIFKFASEVVLNNKAQLPHRKITRIVCPFAGDIAVTVTARNLKELPNRPRIRFPYELKKNIIIDEIIVFIRVKNFIRISWNIKIILPFYYKLFGKSVKQRKPCKMTVLRNRNYLIREFNDITEIRVVRYNCITSLRRIFILPLIKERNVTNFSW